MKSIGEQLSSNFNHTLDKVYVINSSFLVRNTWNILKSFIYF